MNSTTSQVNNAKDTVLSFIKALNDENFALARTLANDNLSFIGVLGSRDGADAYFRDMENMKLKYDIRKAFADGEDVCLLYDIDMAGLSIFGCGWYHLVNGKISSLRVVFDPRPVLELSDKK
jgi:hypothetical protein